MAEAESHVVTFIGTQEAEGILLLCQIAYFIHVFFSKSHLIFYTYNSWFATLT